jgi:hypothetical protein
VRDRETLPEDSQQHITPPQDACTEGESKQQRCTIRDGPSGNPKFAERISTYIR